MSIRGTALLIIGIVMASMVCSCGRSRQSPSTQQRQIADSIATLNEKGNRLREQSNVDEALEIHSEALRLAETADDQIAQAQVMNSIGKDYRRMGILDMAQRYH